MMPIIGSDDPDDPVDVCAILGISREGQGSAPGPHPAPPDDTPSYKRHNINLPFGWIVAAVAVAAFLALAIFAVPPASSRLLPPIRAFLAAHPELGDVAAVHDAPGWAKGARQRLAMADGREILFYLVGGDVVTAWDVTPGRARKVVWGDADL